MKYLYITLGKDNKHKIGGVVEARHTIEARHNAQIQAGLRGADARYILVNALA